MADSRWGWVRTITPMNVLKWSGVIFLVCLMGLFTLAVILSMFGVF